MEVDFGPVIASLKSRLTGVNLAISAMQDLLATEGRKEIVTPPAAGASPCAVQFCRKGCPILPEGALVTRGSGDSACDLCQKEIRQHEMYGYPSGMRHVYRTCDGQFWHT